VRPPVDSYQAGSTGAYGMVGPWSREGECKRSLEWLLESWVGTEAGDEGMSRPTSTVG
jgi:hypothetical protein